MNWDAIGAIAEAFGAAGVIASLLYLAVQVRASTRASAIESKLASTRFSTEFYASLVQSPEVNDLMIRGRADLDSLSPGDYYRFSNLALLAFHYFSAGYFQWQRGALSESDWVEYMTPIRYWIRSPGGQQWWRKVGRHFFGPEFGAFVESEMDDTSIP